MHGSGGIEMKFPWQTMVQLRSLSFTAIGRTQHDTTWTRENFQKKIATTGMGFPRKKWKEGGDSMFRGTLLSESEIVLVQGVSAKDQSFGVKLKLELKAQ